MADSPCIYSITSPSGKSYIGSTVHAKTRKRQHFSRLLNGTHHCTALKSAYKKYGPDKLVFLILEWCDSGSLIEREQRWIDHYRSAGVGLYNSSLIAGRVEMTEETRGKISKTSTGRSVSRETRRKMAEAKLGYTHTEDAKQKMSRAKEGSGVSGLPGIVWHKQSSKWEARKNINGKRVRLGRFKNIDDAIKAQQLA